MQRKRLLLPIIISAGLFLPISVQAEDEPVEEEPEEKLVTVNVTDPEGNTLKGTKLALYDTDNPDTPLYDWTVSDSPYEIKDLEENHSYFIQELEVPNGFYYLQDTEIKEDDEAIILVNPRIELNIGIEDPFADEQTAEYRLQILDEDNQVITEATLETSGTAVSVEASNLTADKQYFLHFDSEQYYPDIEFEIPRYEPEDALTVMGNYSILPCRFEVNHAVTKDELPDVTLQVLDQNDYVVYEVTTEKNEDDDQAKKYVIDLIAGEEYTIHIQSVPDYFVVPEDQKITLSITLDDEDNLLFTIELSPYVPLIVNVTGNDIEPINDGEYTLYTDEECKTTAADIDGKDAILKIENGKAEVNLSEGTYYIKETVGASHYYKNSKVIKITLDSEKEKTKTVDITLKRIEANIIVKDINGIMVDCMIQLIDSDGNMLYEWSSDDVIGISDLYAGNSYTVRITGTPAGYFIPEDTELLIPDEAPDKDLLSKTIKVYPFKVMIRSVDSDSGTPISGNKMQLFSDGKLITEWTSQNGYTSVSGIYAGKSYTIHQKNTADHYLPGEDVFFTIPSKPTGKESVFSYQVTNTPYVSATGSVHSISGGAVSGAKYGIYTDVNCTSPAKTITGESALFTSDTSGTFTADLRNGTYYVRQIDVPASYYRNNDVYVLTVNRGKSVTAVLDLSCKQVRYSFSVVDNSDNRYIPGAHMRLSDADGKLIAEWVTGKAPYDSIQLERDQMYVLEQSSPASGYIRSGSITFHVSEYEPSNDIEYITVRNVGFSSFGIHLSRSDVLSVPLGNGQFALFTDADCTKLVTTVDGGATMAYTDWNGTIYWNLLDGKYYLKEMAAPSHFYIDPAVYEIYVSHRSGATIKRISNVPITFYVSAADGKILLKDAVIQVFDSEDKLIEEWTTDGLAHLIDYTKLDAEMTYRIHIKTVPIGYEAQDEDIYFTLPSTEPDEIPTVLIRFTKVKEDSGKKDEIKPDVTPEPETPEEKMQKADKWVLPIILAITTGIGFLLFLIFKRRKEEKNEAEQ